MFTQGRDMFHSEPLLKPQVDWRLHSNYREQPESDSEARKVKWIDWEGQSQHGWSVVNR